MSRYLLCVSAERVLLAGCVVSFLPDGERFEIIEGLQGETPADLQQTHVSRGVAESLVRQYSAYWEIVDGAEVEELELMMGAK